MSDLTYPLQPEDLRTLVRRAVGVPQDISFLERGAEVVVAIGAFDGVHCGHRALIEACREDARRRGCASVVVTFDPDPSELLDGAQTNQRLLSIEGRVRQCRALGIDHVMVIPFTRELAVREPFEFVNMLTAQLGTIAAMHVGENFHFGRGGAGSAETLRGIGERMGFDVVAHPLLELEGAPVSSTRIRGLLREGKVSDAARLLGRCHYVQGTVAHGRGEGTSFGFPTANVCCDARVCMPAEGVYACVVSDGVHAWPAAANVGAPPTFAEHRDAFLEANLIGFKGNLYNQSLEVIFVEWLRASRPFSSLEELERVVLGNIDWVRTNIGSAGVEVCL